jgi:hypothetical protein
VNAVLLIGIGNRLPSVSLLNRKFFARKSKAEFPFVGDFLSSLPTASLSNMPVLVVRVMTYFSSLFLAICLRQEIGLSK